MAEISYSRRSLADLERLADFLHGTSPTVADETALLIIEAVSILNHHPLMGRPVEDGLRELTISRGRTGYVALYHFEPSSDAVLILSLRHQREMSYR